jgi:hypothetical protein
MVSSPIQTVKGIGSAIANYDQTWGGIKKGLSDFGGRLASGDPTAYGQSGFEIASLFFPAAKASELSHLKYLSKGDEALKLAKAESLAAKGTGKSLLPGEGAVGSYDDLIAAGTKGDNITPHHIPSANHMAQHGVSKEDGIAINMEQPFPGSGGRHRATFTYGTQADLNLTPRQALGRGIWDTRRIYQQDGLYSPSIRSSLQDLIRQNRAANPGLFDK